MQYLYVGFHRKKKYLNTTHSIPHTSQIIITDNEYIKSSYFIPVYVVNQLTHPRDLIQEITSRYHTQRLNYQHFLPKHKPPK